MQRSAGNLDGAIQGTSHLINEKNGSRDAQRTAEEDRNDGKIARGEQSIEKGEEGDPDQGNHEQQRGHSPLADHIDHPALMQEIILQLEGGALHPGLKGVGGFEGGNLHFHLLKSAPCFMRDG